MSRISCDVTKDLLSSYLDEICSEESKELVEEHLGECASCRDFLAKLQKKEVEKDTVKVDYLKKIRDFMNLRMAAGFVIFLALIFWCVLGANYYGSVPLVFYYVEMPVLMSAYAFWINREKRRELSEKAERLVLLFGFLTVCAASLLYYICVTVDVENTPAEELVKLGPRLYFAAMVTAAAAVVLLAVTGGKKRRFFLIGQNLAWLGMNLALSLSSILRNLSTVEALRRTVLRNIGILGVEFAAVTVLLFLIRRLKK